MAIAASFTGFVGQDAELRYTQGGSAVLSFSVATTHYDKTAENNRGTQWVKCSLFGRRGETMGAHIKKGSCVFVRGEIKIAEFTSREGVKFTNLECKADDVEFAGSRGDGAQAPRPATATTRTTPSAAAQAPGAARGYGGFADEHVVADDTGGFGGSNDDLPFVHCTFNPYRSR